MWTLVRNDDAFGHLAKWTVGAAAITTQWLGWVMMLAARDRDADPWLLLTVLWLVPALYQLLGPLHTRTRDFHLGLPLDGRRLWTAHLIAVLVASGLVLVAVLGIGGAGLVWTSHLVGDDRMLLPDLREASLPVFANIVAWWALLAAGLQARQPHLTRGPRRRELLLAGLPIVLVGGLLSYLGGRFAPWLAVVPAAAAVLVVIRTRSRAPAALVLAPRMPIAGGPTSPVAAALSTDHRPSLASRWPGLTVLAATARHRALLGVAYPVVAGCGWMLSRGLPTVATDSSLGFLFLPITAYCMFAFTAGAVPKLALFDHLPLGRRHLLSVLIVPQVFALGLGYGIGEIMAAGEAPRTEPIAFGDLDDRYGLRLWVEYFGITWNGEAPVITAPWGESHEAQVFPLSRGAGPALYKPYTTPAGCSLDFATWQLERATDAVFGRAITAEEITTRYLTTNLEGTVVLRGEALGLVADHPELKPRESAAVPALQILILGTLYLVVLGAYLGVIRATVGETRRKWIFGSCMAALLIVHTSPFVLEMTGLLNMELATAFMSILGRDLAAALPGGVLTVWMLSVAVVAVLYGWVTRRAAAMELPTPDRAQGCGFGMGL